MSEQYEELVDWLGQKGHTHEEIEKILGRVREYEKKMQADSVMNAIGSGELDFEALIEEALRDPADD